MRVVGETIAVEAHGGLPQLLYWAGKRYRVRQVLDSWRWAGRWWLHETPRDYWLLEAPPLTAEIYRVQREGHHCWVLSRIVD